LAIVNARKVNAALAARLVPEREAPPQRAFRPTPNGGLGLEVMQVVQQRHDQNAGAGGERRNEHFRTSIAVLKFVFHALDIQARVIDLDTHQPHSQLLFRRDGILPFAGECAG
jgi:hypothetical protein